MVVYKVFKLGVLVVLIFVLLTGLTASAQSQEENTETGEMDQSSTSKENEYASQTHTIVLREDKFSPEIIEVNQHDKVIWRNLNKPKRTFVLESDDNLWKDFSLGYGKSFEYTFDEVGDFGFSIKGEKGLEGTVIVRESKETAVAPTPEKETRQVQQGGQEGTTETIETVKSSTSKENEYASQMYTIVLRNDEFSPKITEINQNDTVRWRNLNKPKRTFVLVSDDNLWEDFSLGYGRSFEYTFNRTGNFGFSIKGEKGLEGTVVVRESRETAVAPTPEKETRQVQQGGQEGTTETIETVKSSTSKENEYASQTYTIVLRNDEFSPKITEINQNDTVMWRNLNKPKRTFVLVSDDNLWKDFSLGYGKSFEYTFDEVGDFGFSIKGEKGLEGIVVVRESKETAVAPTPEKETRQIQQGEIGVEKEEATPTPAEEATPGQTTGEVQISENSVVIRGSVFYPEALTLNKGETLVWKNLNKPKHLFTLISDEKLFEDQNIGYGRSFSYTFEEAGNYIFKLKEAPETKLIVTVE